MAKDPFGIGKPDARGNYRRSIGVKLVDGEYKEAFFYLGRDRAQAAINVMQLEKVWNAVHDRWYRLRDGIRASWDEVTYEIAKAVGLGKDKVEVPYPCIEGEMTESALIGLHSWLAQLQERFPFIQILPEQNDKNKNIEKYLWTKRELIKVQGDMLQVPVARKDSVKLAVAVNAYRKHIANKYLDTQGETTDHGILVGKRINNLVEHLGDKIHTGLDGVGATFLYEWEIYWQKRPTTKRGKPCSKEWAEGVISTIRDFIRWLDKSDDFQWDTPKKYEKMPRTVKQTEDEIAGPQKRIRYTRSELPTLYEYATPRERVFILLALNCGFGEGEIATLRLNEINLEKRYIKRRRRKTKVPCKWRLWPETVAALKWYTTKVRPVNDCPQVFISEKGKPILTRTKGKNRSQYIANTWNRLYKRIIKDRPDFVKMSFNKLRKTGSNWIRQKRGQELADLYLGHGKKGEVDAYTEKPYVSMFKITGKYRRAIAAMFQAVADPFPEIVTKSNPSLSRGKIKRLQHLRQQGLTLKRIALDEKVSLQTVQRYTRKPG